MRSAWTHLVFVVFSLGVQPVYAQATDSYPARPVTVIVPQAAGGANDIIARIVAPKLSAILGQPMVIENRPGAGGTIGTAAAARSKPDGYTLMLTTTSAHVVTPALYRKPGFDPIKDFSPVATVATAGYVLVANPSFKANSMKELIETAKASPGSVAFASAGNGTLNHLIGEMIKTAAGIDMLHVPYKASAAAAADVVGGQVPVSVQSVPSSLSLIKAGKLKAIGVSNDKRLLALPEVPTIGETLAGFSATPWYGVFVPAGTPAAIISKLKAAIDQVLTGKEVVEQLAVQGCEVYVRDPAQFVALINDDLQKWAATVKASGAKLD